MTELTYFTADGFEFEVEFFKPQKRNWSKTVPAFYAVGWKGYNHRANGFPTIEECKAWAKDAVVYALKHYHPDDLPKRVAA